MMSYGQQQDVTVSGSIQSDMLLSTQNKDDATSSDDFMTNTYADVLLQSQYVDAGTRFEYMEHPLPGFEKDFKGWGVPHFWVKGKLNKVELTAGTFYEQFGSGFILRTYEERSLGIDNSLRGGRLVVRPVKGVQLNVSANVCKGLNLSANYVYTDARYQSGDQWVTLERSIRHVATIAANYHHDWGKYGLNVNLNGRLQSKTYYPDYEDAPGFGVWNLNTTHSLRFLKGVLFKPSIGIDNIFDKVDRRIDSSTRKYALYSPGRMLVGGGVLKFWR